MSVYNDLLFNNISSLVAPCFPVARSILGETRWDALMRDFFSSHRCRSPFVRQLPEEFLQFMQEREPANDKPEFLLHLLHYEWVELALDLSDKEVDSHAVDTAGDPISGRPALTPVHMLLAYPYAVHRISQDYQPAIEQREETCLLVFRNPADEVKFIVLNSVSARLVALLEPGTLTGNQAVGKVISELQHPDTGAAAQGGLAIIRNLRDQGAILGTFIGESRGVNDTSLQVD